MSEEDHNLSAAEFKKMSKDSIIITYGVNGFIITAEQIADGRTMEIFALLLPRLFAGTFEDKSKMN